MAESDYSHKIAAYQCIMGDLPEINRQTLKKLLDHLKDITEQSSRNKATIVNIAKVFGPTLLSVDKVSC